MNDPRNAARIEREVRDNVEKAVKWEIPVLICFSGNRAGISDEAGLTQCAAVLATVAPAAAQAGVTLAMELLNSSIDHRDYQCDHVQWGAALCERVGVPSVKLLYDIYHMRVMGEDIAQNIRANHALFAHYHVAGHPGRGQPDGRQDIDYPAIYRAIQATGYDGFIGHEFVTERAPLEALREAYTDCAAALAS